MAGEGRFYCFEGIDGSGKSSVARGVCARLRALGTDAVLVARKDPGCPEPRLEPRLRLLHELIWGYGDLPIERLGDHHALYNVASWFAAIDRIKIRPLLAAGQTVVIDNWYYKFLARMALKPQLDPRHAADCFRHLRRPDGVFYLRLPPHVAAARKESFNRGESGSFDGFGPPTKDSFVRYQEQVAAVLERMAAEAGWNAIDTAGLDLPAVIERVVGHVER